MELTRIPIRDIRTNPNNPRRDFGDIAALAESFRLNPADPGEPLQPIVTVRDGNVWRIVDGERRYRAMAEAGAIECWSNVCEDFEEADAVVQMLATDDKRPLDDLERSRGVQTMLLLGVDEQVVERAAHVDGAARIRRAMDVAPGHAAMTIEHLLAVAEADEAGDADAARKIAAADNRDWGEVARVARRKRVWRERLEELLGEARAIGFDVLDAEPAEGELGDRSTVGTGADAEDLQRLFDRCYTHLWMHVGDWGACGYAYMDAGCSYAGPEDGDEKAAEQAALAEAMDVMHGMWEDAHHWLGAALAGGTVPAPLEAWAQGMVGRTQVGTDLAAFEEAAGVGLGAACREPVLAAAVAERFWPAPQGPYKLKGVVAGLAGCEDDWDRRNYGAWADFYDMLADAGWPVPQQASAAIGAVREAIEAFEEAAGGGDGDGE